MDGKYEIENKSLYKKKKKKRNHHHVNRYAGSGSYMTSFTATVLRSILFFVS